MLQIYISSKRMTGKNLDPLLNGAAVLLQNDMEKIKLLNAYFALVFTGKICLQEPEVSETSGKVCSNEHLPTV